MEKLGQRRPYPLLRTAAQFSDQGSFFLLRIKCLNDEQFLPNRKSFTGKDEHKFFLVRHEICELFLCNILFSFLFWLKRVPLKLSMESMELKATQLIYSLVGKGIFEKN